MQMALKVAKIDVIYPFLDLLRFSVSLDVTFLTAGMDMSNLWIWVL
jgi:hypothetical protein